eukprot:COSAG02_NODE_34265_length_486_cov_2.000000_1_plen_71_part_01
MNWWPVQIDATVRAERGEDGAKDGRLEQHQVNVPLAYYCDDGVDPGDSATVVASAPAAVFPRLCASSAAAA